MRHMEIPAQDRNRTSPFPYGGHRFEFRAVGSAQNVSLVNTVLNMITANAFKEVADRIEGGETAQAVAADLINTHVLPSAKAAELPQVAALEAALDTLGKAIEEIHASSGKPQADLARTLRLETMIDIREVCDAAEGLCPADLWTLPTYTDLLFLDQTTNVDKNYFP